MITFKKGESYDTTCRAPFPLTVITRAWPPTRLTQETFTLFATVHLMPRAVQTSFHFSTCQEDLTNFHQLTREISHVCNKKRLHYPIISGMRFLWYTAP